MVGRLGLSGKHESKLGKNWSLGSRYAYPRDVVAFGGISYLTILTLYRKRRGRHLKVPGSRRESKKYMRPSKKEKLEIRTLKGLKKKIYDAIFYFFLH